MDNNNNVEINKMVIDDDQEPEVTVRTPKWLADLQRMKDLDNWRAGIDIGPAGIDINDLKSSESSAVTISRLFMVVKEEYKDVLTDFIDRCHRDYKDPDYSMFNYYSQFNYEALKVFKDSKLKKLSVKVTSDLIDTKFKDGSNGVGITVKTVCEHDIDDILEFIDSKSEVVVDILSMILRFETKSDDGYMVVHINATFDERFKAKKNTDLGVELNYMNNWIRMIREKNEIEFGDTCYGAACRTDGSTINQLDGQIVHVIVYEEDATGRYAYGEYDVVVKFYLPANVLLHPNKLYRISCRISDLEDNNVVKMSYENV